MSENTPYEQLIAARLDHIPVPDLADPIWSSIEAQLDASIDPSDASTDSPVMPNTSADVQHVPNSPVVPDSPNVPDSPGAPDAPHALGTPAQKPASTIKHIGWYVLAAIVVAALLWWYLDHKAHAPRDPILLKPLPETHAPMPAAPPPPVEDSHTPDKPAKRKSIPPIPFPNVPKDSLRVDSPSTRPLPSGSPSGAPSGSPSGLPSAKPDSSSFPKTKPALPDVDLYGSPPPPVPRTKKPRGVKGLTDDDYKITASKDSARKKP